MSFNDFPHKTVFEKGTSNVKLYEVLKNIGLDSKVAIYLKYGPFDTDTGKVNIHPYTGTHWVCYINENCFESYGCVCPKKLSKFIIKQIGHCLYSDYKIQGLTNKRYSYWASYCLQIIHLTEVTGVDFDSAVSNLYYQMI